MPSENNLTKIIFVVFFSLIMTLLIYLVIGTERSELDEATCNSINEQVKQDRCFYDLALFKNDDVFCRKIKDSLKKEECHYELAQKNNDLSLCVRTGEKEESCWKEIIERIKDEKLCQETKNYFHKEKCYYLLALATDNPDMCDRAGYFKESCLRKFFGKESEDKKTEKPDLLILRVIYRSRVKEGESINFTIYIKNKGVKKTNSFYVKAELFDDQRHLVAEEKRRISGLYSESAKGLGFILGPNKSGWFTLKVVVDYYNEIAESNEANNQREQRIYVEPAKSVSTTSPECIDSDGGKNYYVRGITNVDGRQFEDECIRSTLTGNYDGLREFYCQGNKLGHVKVKCSNTCNNGECYGEIEVPECIDKDGGEDIYVASETDDEYGAGRMDCCTNGGSTCVSQGPYVKEAICKSNPQSGE